MRALTIIQPYAALIMSGAKRVENRSWSTKYRGRMYIHAGRSRDMLSIKHVDGIDYCAHTQQPIERLAFGAVVGMASLIDCLPKTEISGGKWDALYPWIREHEHTEGPWCWVFAENPTPIGPWPYKGAQGLFDINPDTLNRIANRELGVAEPQP